jgi:acetyl-CoA carboxylase biotin carboxyl carrier protein
MEETNIRKYAQLMQELDLTGLEISEQGKTVRLERASSVVASTPVSVVATNPAVSAPSPITESADPNLVSVRSPMVGVFYAAPAENQRPFVSVGDQVHKGDVLCIIESMKLMNEITSDYDGIVTEISVGNQQVVDYGHVLFQIRKEKP